MLLVACLVVACLVRAVVCPGVDSSSESKRLSLLVRWYVTGLFYPSFHFSLHFFLYFLK